VSQVVPGALLEFSRSVLRQTLAAYGTPVYTFQFSRQTKVTSILRDKLRRARDLRGVVCSTPISVKAFFLKYIELLHILDLSRIQKTARQQKKRPWSLRRAFGLRDKRDPRQLSKLELQSIREEVKHTSQIHSIFQRGCCLLDEVDLILHPLKSELNWPLGEKTPLDLTMSATSPGLRWAVPLVLIDAIVFHATDRLCVDQLAETAESWAILQQIKAIVQRGIRSRQLQYNPHLIILDPAFYSKFIMPTLARYLLVWLRLQHLQQGALPKSDALLQYLELGSAAPCAVALADQCGDELLKLISLSHQWLTTLLPHVLTRINRVHYGLLWPDDVQRSLALNPTMPRSRQLVAVPFVGKDVPSAASEFSNPDIVVGLTILAFRYEGVRPIDFVLVIRRLQEALQQETGPHAARPSAIRWAQWVAIAGGYVRGVARRDQEEYAAMGMNDAPSTNVVAQLDLSGQDTQRMKHCWPLHLLDTHDEEQMDLLYRVLGGSPSLQRDLLDNLIFPQVMEAQESKLSASGQEVGGDVLFGVRLGFSGTPSDLLPEEMKPCCFEQGDDASIISVLTDPCNVSYTLTDANWCVTSLLDSIAASSPSYHALIDTGALITGMTNRDVAQYLLQRMPAMEGVVFLDRDDAKQILVRAGGMQQMRLEDSGVALSNRFTYYDQAHTTGMDIKQTLSARAGVTLGKDMTFRDYAQGAYRMRGIGIGQTISLLVTPEIASLISSYVKSVETTAAYERNSIVDVCGWLAMNGMRSEGMQDQLRAEQSLHNVWRKTAYRHLLDHGQLVGTEDADNFTTAALEVFLERLDFTVRSNTGNVSEGMRDRLSLEVDQATAKGLLSDKQAVDDVHAILATVPATSAHRDERMDSQQEQEEEEEEEQEQEQEEEQQQEEEQEQEQQQQTEEYTQQKYVRETMTAEPWEVERLASRPTGKTRRFFPLNSWSGVPGVAPLDCIPSWLYLSRNHSASKPSNVTRFKNIIAVMEWTCPGGASPSFGDTGQDSDERAAHLCRVFELFDADCSKAIEAGELAEILNATGVATSVNEDEPATTALLKGAQQISFQALQNVLIRDELYGIDRDRAFCALSLSEAETLRAILHARGSQPLLSGAPGVTVGLRLLTVSSHNASLLDASAGFNGLDSGVPGVATSQSRIASSCFRFADSATEFDEGAQALLLRSVEGVTPEARTRWWSAVRSCRRRTQGPYGELSVARVLILSHLPTLLETRALRFRINRMIRLRGLSLTDSFRRFNVSSSGHLTCSELYSGVRWLGLELTVQQTHDMMRAADSDRDGRLTLRDWRNTLERRESDDAPWSTAAGNIAEDFSNDTIEQHTIEEISVVLTENAEVTAAAKALSVDTIRAVKVKPRPLKPKNLNLIWDSSSTGSRDSVSIWAMAENANKLLDASKGIFLLSLGHYASSKLAKTPKDVTALRLRGDSINAVTSRFTPHPRRYRLVWQKTVGDAPLYVWQIVPPSTGFVALGMVSTTSDEPPPLEAAVCVPWRWVQASQFEPKLVWTDRGTGGRPGSIWIVNEMGTLAAADGHSKPPPPPPGCAAVLPNGRWPTLKSGFHVDPKDGTGGLTPTRMWKKAGLVRVAVALSRSSAATHTPRRSSGDISSSDSSNDSEEEPGSGSDGDNNDTRTIEVFETAVDDVEVLDYEEEEQFEEYYSSTGSSSDEDGGDGSENSIDGDDLGME
jgi:Ca2+-binding EF-hand superfamily protein